MADEEDTGTGSDNYTITNLIGKTRQVSSLEKKERLYVFVSILNILVTIVFTIYRLVVVEKETDDFTFALLLLINAVFCIFYVIHGVLRERQFEVYAFMCGLMVVLVYCIAEYIFNKDGRTSVKLARMIVACVLAPVNLFLAWKAAKEFGFLEFRIVGASQQMQHMLKQTTIFSTLLKFDVQVSVSFVVLVLQEGTKIDSFEMVTLAVGLPFCIIWAFLGWIGMRIEKKWIMGCFAFLTLAAPAYIIYKMVKIYNHLHDEDQHSPLVMYSAIGAGALLLIVHVFVAIETVIIYRNFGKGLRERVLVLAPNERTGLLSNN